MRELKGNEDLQVVKDLLCGFEEEHYGNLTACSDIREGLFWDEEIQCYSADLGMLLRETTDEVRVFEIDEDGFIGPMSRPLAIYKPKDSEKTYIFGAR